jgi:AMMECR1 domain-containing protein
MSEPQLIKVNDPSEYAQHIVIWKHGLIAENDYTKGLLLPQVATEYKWNPNSIS